MPSFLKAYLEFEHTSPIIANVKISCYMKQQSHSSECARQLTSTATEKNDVSHGVIRCNVVSTLERCKKYMKTFAKQSNFWRDFFIAMAETWKKLKTSNMFSSFIVCSNRSRSALVSDLLSNNLLFDRLCTSFSNWKIMITQ